MHPKGRFLAASFSSSGKSHAHCGLQLQSSRTKKGVEAEFHVAGHGERSQTSPRSAQSQSRTPCALWMAFHLNSLSATRLLKLRANGPVRAGRVRAAPLKCEMGVMIRGCRS